MKVISNTECRDWLKTNIGSDLTSEGIEAKFVHGVTYRLPCDTGKKTALGRAMVGILQINSACLFWITATGIWPSSENMALFDGYRKSFGEGRSIREAPGHILDRSDVTQLECLLDLALYFYWDSLLLEVEKGTVIKTSHDEYISIRAKDHDRLSRIEPFITELDLERLDRS